jgi:hypothetical protein
MNPHPFIFLAIASIAFSSCTFATKDGDVVALGGKGAYGEVDPSTGKKRFLVWNNIESFREAMLAGAVAVGAWQAVATEEAVQGTAQAVNKNATKVAITESNNATKIAEGAQTVEIAKIPKQ